MPFRIRYTLSIYKKIEKTFFEYSRLHNTSENNIKNQPTMEIDDIFHIWIHTLDLANINVMNHETLLEENLENVRRYLQNDISPTLLQVLGFQYLNLDPNQLYSSQMIIENILNFIRSVWAVSTVSSTVEMEMSSRGVGVLPLVLCLESNQELQEQIECPICFESRTRMNINKTGCQHEFCHTCIVRHLTRNLACPLCRATIKTVEVKDVEQYDAVKNTNLILQFHLNVFEE